MPFSRFRKARLPLQSRAEYSLTMVWKSGPVVSNRGGTVILNRMPGSFGFKPI